MEMDFGGGDEIRFERTGRAGIVTLTRPKALNAVTHRMVGALSRALTAWEADHDVALVVIKAEGRAFSAGGDILHIYEAGRAGNPPVDFFADEYRLNAQIARFPKPYVALIDGIVMGGGVGVSFHGSHRVMTENAQFAMPEVGIGFFPDVGGSHLLPDLGGHFGMYLALTGNRIRYGDALWSGLATHTMKAEYLPGLIERLCETGDAELALREVFTAAPRETDRDTLEAIARHFSKPSLYGVLESLKAEAAIRRIRRQDARHASVALADQPFGRLPADQRRADHVDGRLHADGVPHRQPHAGRSRFLRGHPRRDHRQGLDAGLAAGAPRGCRSGRYRRLFRNAWRQGTCPLNDSASRLREIQPSAVEGAFALFLRVVAAYCLLFGILYWIRLIGLYDGRAVALRPDAGALADRGGDAVGVFPLRCHRPVDAVVLGAGHLVHLRGHRRSSCMPAFPISSAAVR